MSKPTRSIVHDLRGASRLAIEATKGVTGLVHEMHRSIASGPAVLGKPLRGPATAVTGAVYGGIRGVTTVVGAGIDAALAQLEPLLGEVTATAEGELVLAALNGVLGDYLVATDNPLAMGMSLRRDGELLGPAQVNEARGRILLTVHGSCMNDRQWRRHEHDHGEMLAEQLDATRVDVLYNTGLHISTNGRELAGLLQGLIDSWPVPIEELVVLTHSMGGLVVRSACAEAEAQGLAWRPRLTRLVFLGTPHQGAPLERGGNWIDVLLGVHRYSAPLARLGKIRSAGVTDLRYGNVLNEHWTGRDRFAMAGDPRGSLALPHGVRCFAVAGHVNDVVGDGVVPVPSALGKHADAALALEFDEADTLVVPGANHLDLLDHQAVREQLTEWLASPR